MFFDFGVFSILQTQPKEKDDRKFRINSPNLKVIVLIYSDIMGTFPRLVDSPPG